MFLLYYHGGSTNHGCEAIVRSTAKILNTDLTLFTTRIESDRYYGLDNIVTIKEDAHIPPKGFKWLRAAVDFKLYKNDKRFIRYARDTFFSQVKCGSVNLSIGGDNYCYTGQDILGYYNEIIHQKGGKTVLWGCSFDPKYLTSAVERDIACYDLIVAREQLSYECLKKVNPNTVLFPDPAFQLDQVKLPLPDGFADGNTIGINVSPLIMKEEAFQGITEENYIHLIQHIVDITDCQIALIPHVVEPDNDDRELLNVLFRRFARTGRVVMIGDCRAPELKGYISRCRIFIGARTHATIAAYSTCVPTLAVGYSIKARGIARELFGEEEHYVLPVQSMKTPDDLSNEFDWIYAHETKIRNHLQTFIPAYVERCWEAGKLVREMERR